MRSYSFVTVDVFTERRFGGNPLAVFPDAHGLSAEEMQALAAELNLSETAFVLPPSDPANTARVRIFHRTAEMPFAGHPNIGTAIVLARMGRDRDGVLLFEEIAGRVEVRVERDAGGAPERATLTAPRTLSVGAEIPARTVAACVGLHDADVVLATHPPRVASVGVHFVIAQVAPEALARAIPDVRQFRVAVDERPDMNGRFSLLLYAPGEDRFRARMFAPLAGTVEDPATGSANAALAALLLSHTGEAEMRFQVSQGVEMGRPSLLDVSAFRTRDGIAATVAGGCVPMFRGTVEL